MRWLIEGTERKGEESDKAYWSFDGLDGEEKKSWRELVENCKSVI